MTCRIQEDPEGRTGLLRRFGRTKSDHCRLGGIEVVNEHVEVHLLGPLLTRPRRRRHTGRVGAFEGQALPFLVARTSWLGANAVPAYAAIRYYFEHPEQRLSLDDGALRTGR